jgi:hypothetical protein
MKKVLLSITAILISFCCLAQEQLAFPFQGGKIVMTAFFKENVVVSPEIIQKKATGMVLFKFTADEKGKITKMIVYYADDAILAAPVIDALKKSNRKWIIPDHEKYHDFIIPFSFSLNALKAGSPAMEKPFMDAYRNRQPVLTVDQVPLGEATLLPAIIINYDVNL